MSVLSNVAGMRTETTEDFLQAYVDSITEQEWAILAGLGAIKRVLQLVTVVADIRRELAHEIPAQHPLAAARGALDGVA